MLHAAVLGLALVAGAEKPKLAVLELQGSGVPAETATALYDTLVLEVSRRGYFEVMSSKDIQTLLGLERQKQVMGCGESSSSCMAELAGALGSRFVLSGTVSKLGDALQLSLQMLDTTKNQPVARTLRIANDVRSLAEVMPWAVAEATGTPAPPQPSTVLPWSMVGVGAVAAAVGVVAGIDGFSRDQAIKRDLAIENTTFKSVTTYQDEATFIGREKTVALAGLLAGAALVTGGIFLFPKGPGGAPAVAVVPTTQGFAVAGVWP